MYDFMKIKRDTNGVGNVNYLECQSQLLQKKKGLNIETLRDWMNAYNNIHGKFINVNTVSEKENNIIEENDVRVNMLSEVENINKSSL